MPRGGLFFANSANGEAGVSGGSGEAPSHPIVHVDDSEPCGVYKRDTERPAEPRRRQEDRNILAFSSGEARREPEQLWLKLS